jgi:hypothetical protein
MWEGSREEQEEEEEEGEGERERKEVGGRTEGGRKSGGRMEEGGDGLSLRLGSLGIFSNNLTLGSAQTVHVVDSTLGSLSISQPRYILVSNVSGFRI